MLAPRKTLWSTPESAVEVLNSWRPLQPNDCVCDIGCGDGRVILQWATKLSKQDEGGDSTNSVVKASFLGIDIDQERIQQCQAALENARQDKIIHENISIHFVCANALDNTPGLFQNANIFFLYLIPRGLKLIHPILLEHKEKQNLKEMGVATYMAKLPGETPTNRALLDVEHQPGAAWPLYLYTL